MQYGILAGYPLVGVKMTLLDGGYHDVDSSEMAFKIAGSMVFKAAARKADPVLLEPMMAVEVTTPEENMGDVIGDLNSRRGHIQAMEERGGARVVKALVPLSEMFGYVGRPAVQDPGPGELLDAVRQLRGGADATWPRRSSRRRRASKHADRVSTTQVQQAGPRRPAQPRGKGIHSGEGQVRADQAARQHRHHRSHRPWQDDADGRDLARAARQVPGDEPEHRGVRPDRQGAGGAAARHHDLDRARRVPDREAALRARRLPRSRRLHQEHDHRRGADGRRDPGRRGHRRPDAADQGARAARPSGRRALHRGGAEQGRHGRRRGDPGARRARGSRAAQPVRVPGRRRADRAGLGAQGARGRRRVGREGPGADGRRRRVDPAAGPRDREAVPHAGRGRVHDHRSWHGRHRPHRARRAQGQRDRRHHRHPPDSKQTTTVTGIEMFRKLLDEGRAGENVGLLLRGIKREEVERGQVVIKPGTTTPHTELRGATSTSCPRTRAAGTRRSSTTTGRSSTSAPPT